MNAQILELRAKTLGLESKTLELRVETLGLESKTLGLRVKKLTLNPQKVVFDGQKVDFEKIISQSKYNSTAKNHLKQIISDVEPNQVLSAQYVAKLLDCSKTSAINLLSKMKSLNLIEPVTGKGKGKYILKKI